MAAWTALAENVCGRQAGPVAVEQAVFTSIRSAGGIGYRVVAASGGLSQPQRQEITSHCPSHASLSSVREDAEAVYAWRLRGGEYALAASRHAGLEDTGRGGQRVHTHVAVLDEQQYRRFGFHPLRVYSAMMAALPDVGVEGPPKLEKLSLPNPDSGQDAWRRTIGIGCNREAVFAVLEGLLAGRPIMVSGLSGGMAAVDAALAVLPLSLRAAVGVSIGLKYSQARPARLTVLDGDCGEVRRLTRGRDLCWLDVTAITPPKDGPEQADWLGLARRWWAAGRREELCALAARVDFQATPAALNRLARLCQDVDEAATAEAVKLEELAKRYARFEPGNHLGAELLDRLRSVIATRTETASKAG